MTSKTSYIEKMNLVKDIIKDELNQKRVGINADMQRFLTIFNLLNLDDRSLFFDEIAKHPNGTILAKTIMDAYYNRPDELKFILKNTKLEELKSLA